MSIEVIVTLIGLVVAGLAAVLGIWVERDPKKPPRYAYALSVLILLATIVGMFQTYMDAKEAEKMESDMARMLAMLDKIAAEHGDAIPELNDLVKTEIAAQSRANPSMVAKVAQRVADDGRDPVQTLSRALPPSEVQDLQRKGRINVAAPIAAIRPAVPMGAPAGSGGPARLAIRLPGAPGADSNAPSPSEPAAAADSAAPAESAAPAASASAPVRIGGPGGLLPHGRPPAGDKPAGDKPAGDKPPTGPKPGGVRPPRVGGH